MCSKQVFHFEGRVRTVDLDDQERAAACTLAPDFLDLLETREAILCVSCYRKVQASSANGQHSDTGSGELFCRPNT